MSIPEPRHLSIYRDAGVAASYDHLVAPYLMTAPAKDLVASLGLPVGGLVLDVGCGSGAATIPAAGVVGPGGRVIALDPSVEMLRLLQRKGGYALVAAEAPGLPFPAGLFDAVLANFVLAHVSSYRLALADMVRVLQPGGRLGATAWADAQSEFDKAWRDVAGTFWSIARLDQAFREMVPWREWFAGSAHLRQALEEAGLTDVESRCLEYRVRTTVSGYLSLREADLRGQLLRQHLEPERWEAFKQQMMAAFCSRFPEPIEYGLSVFLASGMKPAKGSRTSRLIRIP